MGSPNRGKLVLKPLGSDMALHHIANTMPPPHGAVRLANILEFGNSWHGNHWLARLRNGVYVRQFSDGSISQIDQRKAVAALEAMNETRGHDKNGSPEAAQT